MKVRAAVAHAPGKPLQPRDRRPGGTARRRGADRAQGHRRLPHRRLHAVGQGSRGAVPVHPGPRGGRRGGRGRRRTCARCSRAITSSRFTRPSAAPASTASTPRPTSARPSAPPRARGLMPDGTSRFSLGGTPILHYMGTSTFAKYTVVPEIAAAKIRPDAPFDKVCYIGCGVTTGIGAVINTAKVEPGAKVVVFGLGGIGLNVVQGARLVGADQIVGVDVNPRRARDGRALRPDRLREPQRGEGRPGPLPGRASPAAAPTTASSAWATPR